MLTVKPNDKKFVSNYKVQVIKIINHVIPLKEQVS